MDNWLVVVLHNQPDSILKDVFETAFPKGRVVSLFRPGLWDHSWTPTGPEMVDWFRRRIYDPGIWRHRVLTVYESGYYHHYTYALSRLAAKRRGLLEREAWNWTYFHFDNHRDDYEFADREKHGRSSFLSYGNFVDSLAYDHGALPFLIGPNVYPEHDARGYLINRFHIPIYSNSFPRRVARSRNWQGHRRYPTTGTHLPCQEDLVNTPQDAYLSFDLDVLAPSEIVTDFDQNEYMTLRRLCQIVDRVREHKRVFGADLLGLPHPYPHPLSVLTMLILARKVMGMGISKLLAHHTHAKRLQSLAQAKDAHLLGRRNRKSPLSKAELLEIIRDLA